MIDPTHPLRDPKHETFARAVASGETKTKAYALAGFRSKNPASGGSILSRRPEVRARIEHLIGEIGRDLEREMVDTRRNQERDRLTQLEARTRAIINRLETEMNGEGPDTHSSARVAAALNLAKILGITADQIEHTGGMQIEVTYVDQQPTTTEED